MTASYYLEIVMRSSDITIIPVWIFRLFESGSEHRQANGRDAIELPHRRKFMHLAAGVAALPALSRVARAQAYPVRPIHLMVGFPPGTSPDNTARLAGSML